MPEIFIKDFPLSEYNRLKEIEKKAKDKAFIPFKLNECGDVYHIARTESDKQFNAFAEKAKEISDHNLELVKEIEKRKEQFVNLTWEFAEKKVKVDKLEKEIAKAKEISDQNMELRKELDELKKVKTELEDHLRASRDCANDYLKGSVAYKRAFQDLREVFINYSRFNRSKKYDIVKRIAADCNV